MDGHTREVVGRLAQGFVLLSALALGVGAVAVQMGALPHSFSASRSWTVTPDVLSRPKGFLALRVHSNAPLRTGARGFFWYGPDGELRDPGFGDGVSYYRLPDDVAAGIFTVHNVPNPYGRYAGGEGLCAAHLHTGEARKVALLDARSILPLDADDRLAGDARDLWPQKAASVPLARLAAVRTLAYLVALPLADYNRARDILRQAPWGAALAAGHKYDMPPEMDEVVEQLGRIHYRMGPKPVLLTAAADLASHIRAADFPVVLVGADADPATPGANVPDWPAAVTWLAEQD